MERYLEGASFSYKNIFEIFYDLGLISNIVNFVFADNFVFALYFAYHFQTARWNDANYISLESYVKCAPLLSLCNFEISHGLRADSKVNNYVIWILMSSGWFFGNYFWTTYLKVANDIALKRYCIGATFLYRKFLEICYGFWLILKIRKTAFNTKWTSLYTFVNLLVFR